MNPSNQQPSKESELEQQLRKLGIKGERQLPGVLTLLAQEYSRGNQMLQSKFKEAVELADWDGYQAGLDAAISALPEKKYHQATENKAQFETDFDTGCNQTIDQARQNIEKLKEPSNEAR